MIDDGLNSLKNSEVLTSSSGCVGPGCLCLGLRSQWVLSPSFGGVCHDVFKSLSGKPPVCTPFSMMRTDAVSARVSVSRSGVPVGAEHENDLGAFIPRLAALALDEIATLCLLCWPNAHCVCTVEKGQRRKMTGLNFQHA